MESLDEVLRRFQPDEPKEVSAIKRYIEAEFQSSASVAVKGDTVVVTVSSAALANILRLRMSALQKAAKTTRRIVLRIA